MTTPENAAEMEGSDVVESNKSITECPYHQPSPPRPPSPFAYPYPYLPPCCPPPPPPTSSSGGDVHNWQYPLPPHHHPIQHHHHPHQHHPYPPCPYYYYYPPNEYDSQNCSQYQGRDSFSRGNSQSQDLPNIIITPSAEDIPQVVKGMNLVREQREGSVIDTLSRRLSEIAKPVDLDLNMSQEDDKKYVGDGGKEFNNSPSPIKSECENNKISSEDSSDDLLTSSTDPSTTSSFEDCAEQQANDGLQAIKSVTNIQVYNKTNLSAMDAFDDDRTVDDGESMIFDDDEEEEEIVGEELEYDEEEVIIEEMDSEDEEEIEELDEDEEDEVIVMDDLSVIYEENEADAVSPRPTSRISSSVSDSTTLANEICEEEEEVIKEEDEDDDNSNSVTVRLPLKFSFSRSSNDENIATVEVGNSQIEDRRRSFSIASVQADPEEDDSDSQDCDVSVTISLSPSSGSFDRKSSLSPVPRTFRAIVNEEIKEDGVSDLEPEDVSVSFSLPMKNKLVDQTWSGEAINNIAKKKKKKKKAQMNEDSAVQAWMKNSSVFEEKEEKTVVLKKKPQVDAVWVSETTEDSDKIDSWTVKKAEDLSVETRRRNSSIFEDNEEKTVVLQRNDVAKALVDAEAREIKKIKVVEDTKKKDEKEKQIIEFDKKSEENSGEELDFWATLQATRKEAQLFLEKTADYWGKKINGKEKAEATPEIVPIETENPKEVQTEEDFWASIRVKTNVDETKAVEATVEKPDEIEVKKEPKTKTTKPKKKKKVIKAPEKVSEPEHVWSTIKLPNANNRAKIVESTIQMIQSKAKKPKELVKSISTEVEVGDFVASIKGTYDKEEQKEGTEYADADASVSIKATSVKKQTEETKNEDISASISVTMKQKEDIRSNLIIEKAELKTQILNQKFANAFVIPEKPVLLKAILSEWEVEPTISSQESMETSKIGQKWEFSTKISNPISYEAESPKKPLQEVEIVIEESEEVEKPKKKTTKSKKVVEETEGDTLKPPKAKTKKSTKESKKIKKKKQEAPESKGTNEEDKDKLCSATVSQEVGKEAEEPNFWAEIESSKINCAMETDKNREKPTCKPSVDQLETDFWATIEASKTKNDGICELRTQEPEIESPNSDNSNRPSVEYEEPDFWAEIVPSKAKKEDGIEGNDGEADIWAQIEASKTKPSVNHHETDFWAEIDSSKAKTESTNEMHSEVIDIWAEIEDSRSTDSHKFSKDYKETDSYIYTESENNEVKNQETDFWAEVESSKTKNLNKSTTDYQEPDYWAEVGSFSSRSEEKAQQNPDYWSEIESPKYETRQVKTDIWPDSSRDESPVEHKATDFWSEIDSTKAKRLENPATQTDFASQFESSKTETDNKVELSPISKTKAIESDEIKPKTKNKFKKTVQEPDFGTVAETSKPKTKKKSSTLKESSIEIGIETEASTKPKTKTKKKGSSSSKEELPGTDFGTEIISGKSKSKNKSSSPKAEQKETDFWAEIETSKSKTSKKTNKCSSFHVYGDYDVELINLEPVPTYYTNETQPDIEVDFWASISYVDEDTFPKSRVFEEKEADFWASNSSGNETEVNSEVDTGKIDFWVTQRKFETNNGFAREATPKREEESEEVDFWAEIKGSNDDEDEVTAILPKDECEVRRNNYKKAMAFFKNTVNVEKKEESPAPPRNVDPSPICEEEKTPEAKSYNSWAWRESVEHEWEAPEEREVNDVFLIVEDNETEDEPDTLIENNPYEMEEGCDFEAIEEEQCEEEEESSESISDSTPNHFQIEHQYPKPEPEPIKPLEKSIEPISNNKFNEEIKISVKDRIFAFETGAVEPPSAKPKTSLIVDSATPKSNLSRNSSQRSESEIEEDDSGVTDMNKPLSETDTESESFPELRKMTRYQRASTHSRLFKLLQDEGDVIEEEQMSEDKTLEAEFNFKPRKKIVHNVSITRRQNPKALQEAETLTQRRERLSLPLHKNSSIDADNLSSPNSPASPIFGQPSQAVSDKLVNELVQSLLLKKSSSTLKNLPMEKLQAAAKRVLEEELDSLENTSLDSTPALTPQEFKSESYADYYDSWSAKTDTSDTSANGSFEILPSKAFKALQETTATAKRRPWAVRCPRVLSSKTVNRDLARVTESPEIFSRSSNSPEIMFGSERASSVGRWRKV